MTTYYRLATEASAATDVEVATIDGQVNLAVGHAGEWSQADLTPAEAHAVAAALIEAADRQEQALTVRYVPMPEADGGADFGLVEIIDRKPWCVDHGAMNKVSPGPRGFWRCLTGLGRCRAGCMGDR